MMSVNQLKSSMIQRRRCMLIEVVNSVLYEERKREKSKNNLLIFELSNQDEDQISSQISKKLPVSSIQLSLTSAK